MQSFFKHLVLLAFLLVGLVQANDDCDKSSTKPSVRPTTKTATKTTMMKTTTTSSKPSLPPITTKQTTKTTTVKPSLTSTTTTKSSTVNSFTTKTTKTTTGTATPTATPITYTLLGEFGAGCFPTKIATQYQLYSVPPVASSKQAAIDACEQICTTGKQYETDTPPASPCDFIYVGQLYPSQGGNWNCAVNYVPYSTKTGDVSCVDDPSFKAMYGPGSAYKNNRMPPS